MRTFLPFVLLVVLVGGWTVAAQVSAQEPGPAASAGADRRIECASPQGAPVPLDASSTRPAANATNVTYAWHLAHNTSAQRLLGEGVAIEPTLPLGRHEVTLVVAMDAPDAAGNLTRMTLTDEVVVEVVDTTPPTITALASRATLWPPNHKLAPVDVRVEASDACSSEVAWVLASAASDEAADGKGDGRTSPDLVDADVGTPDTRVLLRAERAGPGDGRAYTLTYEARDASGNLATAAVRVAVPHDAHAP